MAIRAVFVLSLLFGKSVNLVNSQSSFYVAFFPGSYNDSTTTSDHHNSLFISSSVSEAGTTCNISYDDDSRQEITININPNLVTKHELPAKTRMSSGVKIANKGVRVQCSKNVSLYGLSDGDFTAIPTESLSQEYIVPGFQSNSFLGVVGTSENTTLDIFIKSTCSYKYGGTAYGNGDVLSVLLQENDVLQITDQDQASGDGCDLGGSRIVASSKVSVFSGTVYYEDGGSHFFLQVPPLAAFSTETIVPRVQTSYPRKNIIRVIAAKNYTILYLPRSTRVLMSGDFVDSTFNFTEDQVITSLLPVLVTQTCLFGPSGGFSTVVPGQDLYQNDYLIQVLGKDLRQEDPYLTVISKTSAIRDLKVNGVYPNNINWVNVTRAPVPYSVGDLHIDAGQQLHISSTSPIFVREHEYNMKNTHGYIGGYDIPRDTSSNHQGTVPANLQCFPSYYVVKINISQLSVDKQDVSNVYMGVETCAGNLDGDILTFNTSYSDCNTQHKIIDGKVYFTNAVKYAVAPPGHILKTTQWEYDTACSEAAKVTDSILIIPQYNSTTHTNISGQIQGSPIHISLYKDATYTSPLQGNELGIAIGSTVYVQVEAPRNLDIVMAVNNCTVHLNNVPPTSHSLIENGCAIDRETEIIITRNQVTRFKFIMFDLPHDQNGLYVTCQVTFCDQLDFSSKCQQTCTN